MLNLPAVPDGDELVTPLNVIVGGKPSPQIMPIQDPNKPSQDGDHREERRRRWRRRRTARSPPDTCPRRGRHRPPPPPHGPGHRSDGTPFRPGGPRSAKRRHQAFDRAPLGQGARPATSTHQITADVRASRAACTWPGWAATISTCGCVEHYLKGMCEGMAEAINEVTRGDIAELGFDEALKRARARAVTDGRRRDRCTFDG